MSGSDSVRIGLADFQFLTRKALHTLIGETPGFELDGEAESTSELLKKIDHSGNYILIVDLPANDPKQIDQILELNGQENFKVLIMTNSSDVALINSLLQRGIKSILTKSCSEQEILNALKALSIGNRFYCNNILDLIMENPVDKPNVSPANPLSAREHEVLCLIAEGNSTSMIADKLHISIHTVNSHRKNIIKKLDISSPVHLVAYAVQNGLVKVDFEKL